MSAHTGMTQDTDSWDKYQTTYLIGDLVKTEFGPAIITQASKDDREIYGVWPLPGWKWRRETWGWSPAKSAWYELRELELIEHGPAHKIRDAKTP